MTIKEVLTALDISQELSGGPGGSYASFCEGFALKHTRGLQDPTVLSEMQHTLLMRKQAEKYMKKFLESRGIKAPEPHQYVCSWDARTNEYVMKMQLPESADFPQKTITDLNSDEALPISLDGREVEIRIGNSKSSNATTWDDFIARAKNSMDYAVKLGVDQKSLDAYFEKVKNEVASLGDMNKKNVKKKAVKILQDFNITLAIHILQKNNEDITEDSILNKVHELKDAEQLKACNALRPLGLYIYRCDENNKEPNYYMNLIEPVSYSTSFVRNLLGQTWANWYYTEDSQARIRNGKVIQSPISYGDRSASKHGFEEDDNGNVKIIHGQKFEDTIKREIREKALRYIIAALNNDEELNLKDNVLTLQSFLITLISPITPAEKGKELLRKQSSKNLVKSLKTAAWYNTPEANIAAALGFTQRIPNTDVKRKINKLMTDGNEYDHLVSAGLRFEYLDKLAKEGLRFTPEDIKEFKLRVPEGRRNGLSLDKIKIQPEEFGMNFPVNELSIPVPGFKSKIYGGLGMDLEGLTRIYNIRGLNKLNPKINEYVVDLAGAPINDELKGQILELFPNYDEAFYANEENRAVKLNGPELRHADIIIKLEDLIKSLKLNPIIPREKKILSRLRDVKRVVALHQLIMNYMDNDFSKISKGAGKAPEQGKLIFQAAIAAAACAELGDILEIPFHITCKSAKDRTELTRILKQAMRGVDITQEGWEHNPKFVEAVYMGIKNGPAPRLNGRNGPGGLIGLQLASDILRYIDTDGKIQREFESKASQATGQAASAAFAVTKDMIKKNALYLVISPTLLQRAMFFVTSPRKTDQQNVERPVVNENPEPVTHGNDNNKKSHKSLLPAQTTTKPNINTYTEEQVDKAIESATGVTKICLTAERTLYINGSMADDARIKYENLLSKINTSSAASKPTL